MESAMAQACHIYTLPTTSSPLDSSGSDSDSSSDDLNRLLDKLQTTVRKIPPYSLGENSLTWVYFVAASRSRRLDHNAFFVARLAELLQRIGHDRVNELLAGLIWWEANDFCKFNDIISSITYTTSYISTLYRSGPCFICICNILSRYRWRGIYSCIHWAHGAKPSFSLMKPSCCIATRPDSSPVSSKILPFSSL